VGPGRHWGTLDPGTARVTDHARHRQPLPSADDLLELAELAEVLLLRFDCDGVLQAASPLAREVLGWAPETSAAPSGRRLVVGDLLPDASELAEDVELDGVSEPADVPGPTASHGGGGPPSGAASSVTAALQAWQRITHLSPGSAVGPHVGPVRTRSTVAWWAWSASAGADGTVTVMARDVTVERRRRRERERRRRVLDALVADAPAAIEVRDVAGHLVLANRLHGEWFPDAAVSQDLDEPARQVAVRGISLPVEETVVTGQGPREVTGVRFPLRGPDGMVTHVVAVAVDATDRRQAERAARAGERLFDVLLRVSPDVVVVVGPDGVTRDISRAIEEVVGVSPMPPTPVLLELVHPDDRRAVRDAVSGLVAGRPLGAPRLRHRVTRPDGSQRILELAGRPIVGPSGRPVGAVVVTRDVTEVVQAAEASARARLAADQAKAAKVAFLARARADLAEPVARLVGAVDRLVAEAEGSGALPAAREAIARIADAARQLQRVAGDLSSGGDVVTHEGRGRRPPLTGDSADVGSSRSVTVLSAPHGGGASPVAGSAGAGADAGAAPLVEGAGRPAHGPAAGDGVDGEATRGGSVNGRLRILHVEDDPASGELVRRLFERRDDVDLVLVRDGATAVDEARRHRPDLVLLDLGLPDVSGEVVLAQLRARPDTAHVPVVVVSADATAGQAERLRRAGAETYMAKPVSLQRLLQVVDDVRGGR
jgi:PAS domain S-box-containing protein